MPKKIATEESIKEVVIAHGFDWVETKGVSFCGKTDLYGDKEQHLPARKDYSRGKELCTTLTSVFGGCADTSWDKEWVSVVWYPCHSAKNEEKMKRLKEERSFKHA